ncbi:hypothetical protein L2E82_06089 [Cichorium intybus]|uniref:Uncharacterized protein n=1 Tax=Cichorium intybus TaxID=13427 RepID=A0ACB9H9M1_CICIN|nr:hypothetical protein L2E82_06089 [Cichorium intybus]
MTEFSVSIREMQEKCQMIEFQQRKCNVIFDLSSKLARVLEFCTCEIPQAFLSGADTNLRRLVELIVFILNHLTSVADPEFFDLTLRRPGQTPKKVNRAMTLAPLVGIILNLLDASLVTNREQNDIVGIFASMDCGDTLISGFQYLLEFNWVGSFNGDVHVAKLRQLEDFSSNLILRTVKRVRYEGETESDENVCCICYTCEADANFVPCTHVSCFRSRHHVKRHVASQDRSHPEQFIKGQTTANLQGRAQIIPGIQNPSDLLFYLDGAHSPESMKVCANWFSITVKEDNSLEESSQFNCMSVRDSQLLFPRLLDTCMSHGVKFKKAIFVPNMSAYNKVGTSSSFMSPTDFHVHNSWQLSLQRVWENRTSFMDLLELAKKGGFGFISNLYNQLSRHWSTPNIAVVSLSRLSRSNSYLLYLHRSLKQRRRRDEHDSHSAEVLCLAAPVRQFSRLSQPDRRHARYQLQINYYYPPPTT